MKKLKISPKQILLWVTLLVLGVSLVLAALPAGKGQTSAPTTTVASGDPTSFTAKPVVSMEWDNTVAIEKLDDGRDLAGVPVDSNGKVVVEDRSFWIGVTGGVSGTEVTVRIVSFDISAKASNDDYTPIDRTVTLKTGERKQIKVPYHTQKRFSDNSQEEAGSRIDTTRYTRIFGVKIASVSSNASIHAKKNCLYARTNVARTAIEKSGGETTDSWLLTRNTDTTNDVKMNKSVMPNGFAYYTARRSYSKTIVSQKVFGNNETHSWDFNIDDTLNETGRSYMEYFPDTTLYYAGTLKAKDEGLVARAGYNFKIYEDGSLLFANNTLDGSQKWEDQLLYWFEKYTKVSSDYTRKDTTVTINDRISGLKKYLLWNGESVRLSLYNEANNKTFYDIINYAIIVNSTAPKIVDISVYDGAEAVYRKGDYVDIAVRFDKPVQYDATAREATKQAYLTVDMGDLEDQRFDYYSGSYTDTIIFRKQLTSDSLVASEIKVKELINQTYDGYPAFADMMIDGANRNNAADFSDWRTTWKDTVLSCNIDTRTPTVRVANKSNAEVGSLTQNILQEHYADVEFRNFASASEGGSAAYVWTQEADRTKIAPSEWKSLSYDLDGVTRISGAGLTGDYYLFLRAVGANGVAVEEYGGTFKFDNTPPEVNVSSLNVKYALYQDTHTVKVAAADGRLSVSQIKMTVKSVETGQTLYDGVVYAAGVASSAMKLSTTETLVSATSGKTLNVYTLQLSVKSDHPDSWNGVSLDIGTDTFGAYEVSFVVQDDLGNASVLTDSRHVYLDNRSTFKVSFSEDKAAGMEVTPLVTLAEHDALPVVNPKTVYVLGTEGAQETDEFFLASVRLDGRLIYSSADGWNTAIDQDGDGEFYDDAGFTKNPADSLEIKNEAVSVGGETKWRLTAPLCFSQTACGYYEIVFAKSNGQQSNVLSLYVASKNTANNQQALCAEDRLLVNKVWQISTVNYYTRAYNPNEKSMRYDQGKGVTAKRPIFSSRDKAKEFVRFYELQDIEVMRLTETDVGYINALNSGETPSMMMASGHAGVTAKAGQTWVKYKTKGWSYLNNPTADTKWAYYLLSDGRLETITQSDIQRCTLLWEAIEDNVNDIVGPANGTSTEAVGGWYYLTANTGGLNSYGEPTYEKAAIFYAERALLPKTSDEATTDTLTKSTLSGKESIYSEIIGYSGDREIYSSYVDYPLTSGEYHAPLVANYTVSLPNNYHKMYYRSYREGVNDNAWLPFVNGDTLRGKLRDSGLYEFAELSGGYSTYVVYCDFNAPLVSYTSKIGETTTNGYLSQDEMLQGTLLTSAGLTINHFLDLDTYRELQKQTESAASVAGLSVEYDPYAYVYLERKTGVGYTAYASYTVAELNESEAGITIPKGEYKLYVYDRLGNYVSRSLFTNPEELFLGQRDGGEPYVIVENKSITFALNRTKNEVRTFEIERDGKVEASSYDDAVTYKFNRSGHYSIVVEDIYGNFYKKELIEFKRKPPQVTFYYKTEAGTYARVYAKAEDNPNSVVTGAVYTHPVENSYVLSISSDVRIVMDDFAEFEYEINNESLAIATGYKDGKPCYDVPYDLGDWRMTVWYKDDPSDLSTLSISCQQDHSDPVVTASVELPQFTYHDVYEENDEEKVGNVLFTPVLKKDGETGNLVQAYELLGLESGASVGGKAIVFEWADDTGVILVEYSVNGGAVRTATAKDGSFRSEEKGDYVVTVMDMLGNRTTFEATLTDTLDFDVKAGEQLIEHNKNPLDCISGTGKDATFSETVYTGKELTVTLREQMLLTFTWEKGETGEADYLKKLFAVSFRDGTLNAYEELTESEAVSIALAKGMSGTLLSNSWFTVRYEYTGAEVVLKFAEPQHLLETFQMRFTNLSESNPFVVQVERSNAVPNFTLKRGDEVIPVNSQTFTGTNRALTVEGDAYKLKSFIAYRSEVETLDFTNVSVENQFNLYAGGTLGTLKEEGYYKLIAINEYGNEQVMLVRISYGLNVEVRIAYAEEIADRNFSLEEGSTYEFYSNREIRLNVWDFNAKVTLEEGKVTLLTQANDGYITYAVREPSAFVLKVVDDCNNTFIIRGYIEEPKPLVYDEFISGFNENAVRRADNYTNAPLSLSKEKLDGGEVEYAAWRKQGKREWTVVYDVISQTKLGYTQERFANCIGTENGSYEVLFTDAYGNYCVESVHVSNVEQLSISRSTQSVSKEHPISVESALSQGAWSNYVLRFQNRAPNYLFTVDGEEVTFDENNEYAWELPLSVAEGDERHDIKYIDDYGNTYEFAVRLYRKVPTVTTNAVGQLVSSAGVSYVRGDVSYSWEGENITAEYTRNGGQSYPYDKGQVLGEDGAYIVTFTDVAGNVTTAHITRDTTVKYGLNSNSNRVENGVTVSKTLTILPLGEEISVASAKKDGVDYKVSSGLEFSEHGSYEVTVQDKIGNVAELAFTVFKRSVQSFEYVPHGDYVFSQIWLEAGDIRLPYVSDVTLNEEGKQKYAFVTDGVYEVELLHVPTSKYFTFKLTVDNIAPETTLSGVTAGGTTRANVGLLGLKLGDTVEVYRDGVLTASYRIETKDSFPSISEAGSYRLVVRDEAGNEVAYEFLREYTTNVASNIIVCVLLLGLAGVGIVLIRGKDRIRTK